MDNFFAEIGREIMIIPKVSKLTITNKGPIKSANIIFKEGLNIILGKNASGKTTVVRELAARNKPVNIEERLCSAASGERIMFTLDGIFGLVGKNECLVIDGLLGRLNYEKLEKVLKKMANEKAQTIVTLIYGHAEDKILKDLKANIIYTKDFEFKSEGKDNLDNITTEEKSNPETKKFVVTNFGQGSTFSYFRRLCNYF